MSYPTYIGPSTMSMVTSSSLIIIFALGFVIIFVGIRNPIQWEEVIRWAEREGLFSH